jgi:hypothetical protein
MCVRHPAPQKGHHSPQSDHGGLINTLPHITTCRGYFFKGMTMYDRHNAPFTETGQHVVKMSKSCAPLAGSTPDIVSPYWWQVQ